MVPATALPGRLAEMLGPPGSHEALVRVPLAAIDLTDDTYRFRMRVDVVGLVEDIRANGQDFPVVLRPVGDGLQLVCGFRRVTALKELGAEAALAVIRELSDDEAYRLAWSENMARQSYSHMDRAHGMLKLLKSGRSLRQVARLFGLGPRAVGKLRDLALMPQPVQDAVGSGAIKPTHGVMLHELKRRYPAMDVLEWLQRIVDEGLSVRGLAQRVGKAYSEPRAPWASEASGRWRLRARTFDLAAMDAEEAASALTELQQLVAALQSRIGDLKEE